MQSIHQSIFTTLSNKTVLLIATKSSSWPSISSAINNIGAVSDLRAISSDLRDVR